MTLPHNPFVDTPERRANFQGHFRFLKSLGWRTKDAGLVARLAQDVPAPAESEWPAMRATAERIGAVGGAE